MQAGRTFLCLALAAAALAPAATAQGDTVILKTGKKLRGIEVTAATASEVTYSEAGEEKKVAAAKVRRIAWGNPPQEYILAETREADGQFDDAAQQFLEAASKSERALVKHHSQFRGARAALSNAGADAAMAQGAGQKLQEYLAAAADGFHAPEAKLLLARSLRLQGQADAAITALEALENTAISSGWGLSWGAHAKYERGLALVAAGNASRARSALQSVSAAAEGAIAAEGKDAALTALKAKALISEGDTYVADQQWDQALAYFRRYSTAPSGSQPISVISAALAGEGQSLFLKAAAANKDAATLRQAQVALAKAHISATTASTSAKALYFTGKVLIALGSDHEKDPKSRAMAYFDTVAQHYPGTIWAASARAETAK